MKITSFFWLNFHDKGLEEMDENKNIIVVRRHKDGK